MALGHADPCLDMKKYSNGLKPIFNKCSTNILNETHFSGDSGIKSFQETVSKPIEHQVLIQNGSTNAPNYSAPTNIINLSHPYNSKLHNQSSDEKSSLDPSKTKFDKSKLRGCEKVTCRILLLFSQDGTEFASQAVALAKNIVHEVSKLYLKIIVSNFEMSKQLLKGNFYFGMLNFSMVLTRC